MNADELIAVLERLTPEQRQLPLISHDRFDGLGHVAGVVSANLESEDINRPLQPCLYVVVKESPTHEWIYERLSILEKSLDAAAR